MQEIERMGGAELFIKAGKRIRYKTFRDVCDEYLSRWGKKDYQGQMQRVDYWCQFFGDRIMTDIDIFDIREHVDDLIDEGQRATTINRKKAVLSSVYKFALSRGYVDENLVRSVVVDDDTKRRDRVLSEAERKRLLKACRESHWDKLYLLVVMAMTTGARKGELMNLRWSDVNFKDSSAYLGDTKNGTSRELYLAPVVMAELKRHQEVGSDLPGNVRDIWHYAVTEMVNNAIDHSGSENVAVELVRDALNTTVYIADEGEGIFLKIQRAMNLYDPREAILELAKGKLTTDPANHTGEGIFFSSKVMDAFDIRSGLLHFMHDEWGADILLERPANAPGTLVLMRLANDSPRILQDVFDQFAAPEE